MKKMSFLLLGLPLLLGSCAAAVSSGSADDVRVGMTEAQVRHLLGGTACPNGHARLGPLALSVGAPIGTTDGVVWNSRSATAAW